MPPSVGTLHAPQLHVTPGRVGPEAVLRVTGPGTHSVSRTAHRPSSSAGEVAGGPGGQRELWSRGRCPRGWARSAGRRRVESSRTLTGASGWLPSGSGKAFLVSQAAKGSGARLKELYLPRPVTSDGTSHR